jgi:spoIIIJ-associated protein
VGVVVVREGRGGLLGLGAEDAVIRVTPVNPPPAAVVAAVASDVEQVARDVLSSLLGLLDVAGTIELQPRSLVDDQAEEAPVALDVTGEDLGILIGRRGQTLAALQYVVRLVVGRRTDKWVPIVIDVEGYKQRRASALETFAAEMAERVVSRQVPFTMEPMPPYERRIVHMALADHGRVVTESIGQGEERKVVIRPKT